MESGASGFSASKHYTLRSLDHVLQVHTEGPIPDFMEWWNEAIVVVPEIKCEPIPTSEGWELSLIYDQEKFEFSFQPESKKILYRGRPQFQEIGLLLSSIFERMYAENGSFSLHASAIQMPSGRGWIFFGNTFSGKTAVVLNLNPRINGLKYIGNERILISSDARIIGGTGAVRVKAGDISNADDKNRELYQYDDFYSQRVHESSIDRLIQIKLHYGADSIFTKQFTWKRSLTTIYGHLGEVLNNTFLLLDNLSYPAPSFSNVELNKNRVKLAYALTERCLVTHFAGNIDSLADFILKEED
jgi:hypothetical protein